MEKYKLWIQRALLVLVVGLIVWFCWTQRETLAAVQAFSLPQLILVLACYTAIFLLNAVVAKQILRTRKFKTSLGGVLAINCWSSLLGYFTVLRVGYYSGKAWYLHRLYGVPITTALGLIAYLALAALFINAAVGFVAGLVAWQGADQVVPFLYWMVMLATMALCLAATLLIFTSNSFATRLPPRMKVWVSNASAVFTTTSGKELIIILAILACSIPLQAQALSTLFRVFGQPLPWIYLVFLAVFSTLSTVVSLTPANLGVREIVLLLVVAHLNIPPAEILSVLLIDRVLQFLPVLVLGMGGYALLLRPGQLRDSLTLRR